MAQSRQARLGRYLLFKSLKKGGMARVFLGVDPEGDPDRLLAIKTLLPALRKTKSYQDMFAAEGKVAVRLEHPNIVRTIEHGVHKGTPFIAMEFIFGFDLSTVLRTLRKAGRQMPLPLAVALGRDVARALYYAHGLTDEFGRPLDIVNRDVSPGNIMIEFDGRVRLIDFGIAQTTIDVKSQIGSIKGKISYMAPEQVRGLPVDHRVDLFSLGTVLYEMMTGLQPFSEEGDFATMEKVRAAEVDPPSTLNPAVDDTLDGILARSMAREAYDRYPDGRALADDLEAWLDQRGGAPDQAVFAAFMTDLFERRIVDMRADIERARRGSLGEPSEDLILAEEGGGARPLISEDMLAEFVGLGTEPDRQPARTPPPPIASADGRSGLSGWLIALVVLGLVGVIWYFGGL